MKHLAPTLLLLCTACSLAPDFHLPGIAIPESWKNAAQQEPQQIPPADHRWWERFGSAELPAIITQAEQQNPDLDAALARIEQARATQRIAGASLWPSLDATGDISRNFNPNTGSVSNDISGTSRKSSYNVGLQASYELDLFGKNRNTADAANERTQASIYDQQALRLSITAQTAQGYFNLLALNARVALAQKTLANAQEVLRITRVRADSGALSSLELAQQENFVASTQASVAALQQEQEASRNALAILLGQTPQTLKISEASLKNLAAPPVPLKMPAEWLAHRPDIANAEAQLKAANFDIGAVRAEFFPSLTLNAGTALAAAPITGPAKIASSIAAGIAAPIFSGGALEGNLNLATAQQKELAANYRKVVLSAFADTENALKAIHTQNTREANLRKAAEAAQVAYDASRVRLDAGAIDGITLLDAQRSLLQAQDAQAQAEADRLSAHVDLFRAMGGSWQPQ